MIGFDPGLTSCHLWEGANISISYGATLFADFYNFQPCAADWTCLEVNR